MVSGSGIFWSDAAAELREFIDQARIPFFTTPLGRGVVPEDHELAFLAARGQAFREADAILVVGTRFNFIISFGHPPRFAEDVKIIQIDTDSTELGHNRPIELGIVADARLALSALTRGREGERPADLGRLDSRASARATTRSASSRSNSPSPTRCRSTRCASRTRS